MLFLDVNDVLLGVDSMKELRALGAGSEHVTCDEILGNIFNANDYFGGATLLLRYTQSSVALRAVALRQGSPTFNILNRAFLFRLVTAISRNPFGHKTWFFSVHGWPAQCRNSAVVLAYMNYVHSEDWPFLVKSLPVTTKLRELKVGRSQPKATHRTHNNWRIETRKPRLIYG
jgi:hypothetical protein